MNLNHHLTPAVAAIPLAAFRKLQEDIINRKEGSAQRTADSPLKDKMVLVVDDEPDGLETVEEELDMRRVRKARDYETARQYLGSHTYHMVILDIMGVSGFKLLNGAVSRGIPTAILPPMPLHRRP